jgi:hypothetical protein
VSNLTDCHPNSLSHHHRRNFAKDYKSNIEGLLFLTLAEIKHHQINEALYSKWGASDG